MDFTPQEVEVFGLRPGDVLVGEASGSKREVGKSAMWRGEVPGACFQNTLIRVRVSRGALPEYVQKHLAHDARRGALAAIAKGIGIHHIGATGLKEWKISIAPLAEQRRIVDKLDALLARVDACRRRLDGIAGILKRFRDAVLAAATSGDLTREWREGRGVDADVQSFELGDAEAIGDFTFPASWSARRMSDIAQITGGVTKDSKKQGADLPEVPYLRVANVQRGYLDLSEVKTIRIPRDRVGDLLLRTGDILFNEGGDIDKLGRGWIWSAELPVCAFQNHVFRARLLDPAFEPRYFSWYGNSRGYDYFLAHGKQTTNLASINKSVLSALPVAVPPAAEQAEIVRRVNDLLLIADRMQRHCESTVARVEALTPSTLAKAFRGELLPQDPRDEPASELLARLGTEQATAEVKPRLSRRKTSRERTTMKTSERDALKAAILRLKTERFSLDELRTEVVGDYESLKVALFGLLEEPTPVVRQVFNKKTKFMQLQRVRP
ncbi:MAG: restriction endonuclease subunit S [Acidobacteriota bacterium]